MTKKDKLNWLGDIADGLRPLDARAIKLVGRLLDDPDPQVRAEAVSCLWHSADPYWIDVLIDKAQHDLDLDVRCRALSALGFYLSERDYRSLDEEVSEDPEGVGISDREVEHVANFLLDTVQEEDASIDERRYALESLAFLDAPEVDALIEWAFRQPQTPYRVSALFAMGRSGNLHWTDTVLAELHSANRQVQYEAVRAAGELGLHEATDDLIRLVRGRGVDKALRLRAIYSLGEAGDDRAYPVLEELCHARDRDVREAAREAAEEWLMSSMTDQEELNEDEDSFFGMSRVDDESPGKDIWDPVFGVFSLN